MKVKLMKYATAITAIPLISTLSFKVANVYLVGNIALSANGASAKTILAYDLAGFYHGLVWGTVTGSPLVGLGVGA